MKHFYILTILICFGCLTSDGQRVLFTDNFGSYPDKESLSGNGSGWDTTGVSDFTNKKNDTYGATVTDKTNFFAQLVTVGAASAYREMELTAGNTYIFKAYIKTTNNKIYSTIRINVGGVDVVTSGNVSNNNTWEELSVEYTPTVNETGKFVIQKTQAGVLNVDKVKIICSSCTNKNVVYDFHDSKEGWVVGKQCSLALGFDGMVVKANSTTPTAVSGDLTQNLDLNTADYNKAKIIFKTPYAISGGGYGKLYLYDVAGGDSHFAIYDFVRDGSNTTTFQTAEVDLTANGDYTGSIARIGVRAPWGIQNNQKFTIQRIELYNECTPVTGTDVVSACDEFTWINGVTYTGSNDTSTHILKTVDGCDSTVTLNLTINTVDDSLTVVDEFTLQANASGATYQWIDCSNSDNIAGETDSVFTTQVSGDYAVVITQNGCTDTSDCFTISNTVGIQDIKNLNYTVKLFPNPTTNSITLNLDGISNVNLELFDIQGKLLLTKNRAFNQEQIDVSAFKTGTYFLRILSNEGNQQIKFEVK